MGSNFGFLPVDASMPVPGYSSSYDQWIIEHRCLMSKGPGLVFVYLLFMTQHRGQSGFYMLCSDREVSLFLR